MAATEADETTESAKGGKKKLIIIIVAALAIVGVAVAVLMMTLLKPKEELAAEKESVKGGVVIPLKDDMTLNLADGKFLKLKLALQLSEEAEKEGGEEIAKTFDGSMAQDAAVQVFSAYKYDQLLSPKGKEEARHKLTEEVKKRYDGDVVQVYFTQFVMQ